MTEKNAVSTETNAVSSETEADVDDDSMYCNTPLSVSQGACFLETSCKFHDYCGELSMPGSVNKETQTTFELYSHTAEAATQTDMQISDAFMQTDTIAEKVTKDIGLQVLKPDIAFEDIENDKYDIMFYTGLPTAGTFYSLFDEMEEMQSDLSNGRPKALRLVDEFFMVLMRLRLGLLIQDLAHRFQISKTTCSETLNKWIGYMSLKLSFLAQWPPKTYIREHLPNKFKKYPNLRVIIDCTEIYTQTPNSLQNRSLMYSHYKSHMTYKALIGITPNGMISFSSDLWTGNISDKQLTKACGILELLEPNDQVMADKGFLISDILAEKGARLIIPPLRTVKFFKREVEETRRVANLRIYVEMAIQRIKTFRILQGVMPITLSRQASQIWQICVYLTNLQPPLVCKDKDPN